MPNRPHDSPRNHCGQSELTVSTALLRVLADVMQQRGLTPSELLGSGVELLYAEPAERMLPLHELRRALAHAAQLAREPALGLYCGLQARESTFGLISPLVAHAATLRRAISVRAMLRAAPAAQLPSMEEVARTLGVSVRSLRRKLDDEGTSFRELTQKLLYELACSLLSDSSLSLQGVAYELGFADPTAFNRAFRRWTNLTPKTYQSGARVVHAACDSHERG